jgi:hypothetical protein
MARSNTNNFFVIAVIAVIAIVALVLFMQPRNETVGNRVGNAAQEVGEGIDDAADELTPNRTLRDRMGDGVEDVGESIKD